MYPGYLNVLSSCLKETFEEMAGVSVNRMHIDEEQCVPKYAFSVIIKYKDLAKKIKGIFLMGFTDDAMAISIASSINESVGLPPVKNLEENGYDTLNEFMNTAVGRTITGWDKLGFSVRFSPPAVIKTPMQEITDPQAKSYLITLNHQNNTIPFAVTFSDRMPKLLEGKRILVVDDSKMVRELACFTLNDAGCTVERAEDGLDAIEKHKAFQPELTIIDINMPNMNGFDAIKNIRSFSPDAKFIMLTSSSRKDEVITANSLHVQAYVIKPLKPPELLERVQKALL